MHNKIQRLLFTALFEKKILFLQDNAKPYILAIMQD